jgi:hypothetical protein
MEPPGGFSMTDTKSVSGGRPVSSLTLVQADQDTIVGEGSIEKPLRVNAAQSGIAVDDDGVPVAGGPFTTIDVTGAGASASDSGGRVVQIDVPGVIYQNQGVDVPGGPHDTVNYTGDGVTASDAGGGVLDVNVPGSGTAAAVLTWGFGTLGSAPAFAQGGWTSGDPSTTNNLDAPVPFSGTARNLYARHNTADGSSSPITYTLMVNGVASALAVSVPTGAVGQASNTTDLVSINAGDVVAMRITSLVNGTYLARISCELVPS